MSINFWRNKSMMLIVSIEQVLHFFMIKKFLRSEYKQCTGFHSPWNRSMTYVAWIFWVELKSHIWIQHPTLQISCTKNRMMLIISSSLCMITCFCLFIILKSHPVPNGNCCEIMRQQNNEYFDHAHNDSCYARFYETYNLLFVMILGRLE